MIGNIKEQLQSGSVLKGPFFSNNAPDLVESAALGGFDFVIFDLEHSSLSHDALPGLIRAAECRGIAPLVRVPDSQPSTILKALDCGVHGIVVPQVNTPEQARRIVRSCHYHPLGERGLGLVRASAYGSVPVPDYFAEVRERLLIIAQCESAEGLDNLEEIVSLPAIDTIFLGPFDLSQSLGIPGETDHPLIREAAGRIVQLCRREQKIAGVFSINGKDARRRVEEGFRFIALGTDHTLFASAVKRELEAFG
jgi:4-hydroxy-2-oxoheptanedioate aldolase